MAKVKTRKRIQIKNFPKSIVDQSRNHEFTMESIVKRLEQGIAPALAEGRYIVNPTAGMDYQDVHEYQKQAQELYNDLPIEVKKKLHNDPLNLEAFISDEKNHEFLLEEGILIKKEQDKSLVQLEKIANALEKNTPKVEPKGE